MSAAKVSDLSSKTAIYQNRSVVVIFNLPVIVEGIQYVFNRTANLNLAEMWLQFL